MIAATSADALNMTYLVAKIIWSSVLLASMCVLPRISASQQNEWPTVSSGTWDVTVTNPSGKQEHHQLLNCLKPHMLFWGYFGTRTLNEGGCKFSSKKVADHNYVLTAICGTEEDGPTVIEHRINLEKDSFFRDTIKSIEKNSRPATYVMYGQWKKGCEQ